MSFWSAVVLIVLVVAVAGIFRKNRQDGGALPPEQGTSAREAELENEVEQLRERVKVLERIATDPARRTAEEIEKLRDE